METIEIHPKGWGHEKWIVNEEKYCGKLLFFKAGKRCSWHYHKIKDETFYVQSGELMVIYGDDEDIEKAIRESADTVYHPVGTCKMGNDDMAVVDSNLKVHKVEGLRVVDASIMPTLVGGNTNAPTIMIGEKASDIILQDWS